MRGYFNCVIERHCQVAVITFELLVSVAFLWFVTNVSGPYIRPIFRVQWELHTVTPAEASNHTTLSIVEIL